MASSGSQGELSQRWLLSEQLLSIPKTENGGKYFETAEVNGFHKPDLKIDLSG
jgi:hypothetical protein